MRKHKLTILEMRCDLTIDSKDIIRIIGNTVILVFYSSIINWNKVSDLNNTTFLFHTFFSSEVGAWIGWILNSEFHWDEIRMLAEDVGPFGPQS